MKHTPINIAITAKNDELPYVSAHAPAKPLLIAPMRPTATAVPTPVGLELPILALKRRFGNVARRQTPALR